MPAALDAIGLEAAEQALADAISAYTERTLAYQDVLDRAYQTLLECEPLPAGIVVRHSGSVRIGDQTFMPRDPQAGVITTTRRVIGERWPRMGLRIKLNR